MEMTITHIKRKRDRHKTRVAAYCRVSTQLAAQEESFETQRTYYTHLIQSNPDWVFAGIYADEKSGRSVKDRPGFRQLIQDALESRVDLILVKSVSRFARNVVDCEKTIRQLQAGGVYVHFQREGIRTEDPASGMILSLMAAIAQDESRSISENVKWSYRQRCLRGEHNLGSNRVLGYDCQNGKLVPNRDSPVVLEIYSRFSRGETPAQIARALNGQGLTGLRGRPFSASGIRYILQNEVYAGDRKLQKQPPRDFLTGQPEKGRTFESPYLTDDHEPIIPRPLWQAVQNRMAK